MKIQRRLFAVLGASFAALALVFSIVPFQVSGQPQPPGDEPALPENVVVDVDAIESQVFRIGIPDLMGPTEHGSAGGEILRRDFTLMPGYTVIGPRQLRHDVASEGMGMDAGQWGRLQANGVIKGQVTATGNQLSVEMRFFQLSRGSSPALTKSYSGAASDLRKWMHDFGNEVLRTITGEAGPFGTHITWAERVGPGRKDVKCGAMDGHGAMRITNGRGVAMLPAFGPNNTIWFTRLTPAGMFITKTGTHGRPIIQGNGLNMAPSICGDRVYFVSSRDGNSEIYSAALDGSGVRRLTNDRAIDVSPTCGPGGKVAFVSARHGTPQIWVMNADGSGQRRVTYRGNHNQTPAFCPDPRKPLLAFTGRDHTLDIFTVNLSTNEYTRVTQGQGMNKDPAWSPDCRIVAFTSDRRGAPGIYLASPQGFNQNRVIEGAAETIRWQYPAMR
jgi:TolB protein